MIFFTVGTAQGFDRLVRMADALSGAEEEVLVQYGFSAARPQHAAGIDFLPFDEFVETVHNARLVVTAAGVGTIMTVLASEQRPVVVPRQSRYGEAVDDHQLVFARRIAEANLVTLVEDERELAAVLAGIGGTSLRRSTGDGRLAAELRDYLRERVSGRTTPVANGNGRVAGEAT